jgi:hypothetical protein
VPGAAVQYAKMGWHVLRVRPNKAPLEPHGVKDAICDPEEVARRYKAAPGCGIGAATGVGNTPVIVDIDGEEGARTWAALIAEHGEPKTWVSRTKNGGFHIWFQPWGAKRHIRWAPGLDLLGIGGYGIVAPTPGY